MRRVPGESEIAWLVEATEPGNASTGFPMEGWAESVWLLHAMWETGPRVAPAETRGDAPMADATEPMVVGGVGGPPLGGSARPGADWRRLTWDELGRRHGIDPLGRLPGWQTFPREAWTESIRPPAEGALDLEQYERLCVHLDAAGPGAACTAYFTFLHSGDWEEPAGPTYSGLVSELPELYDVEGAAPANIWPQDRSWFVYTDTDLWGTKVSGPPELIAALEADPELETVFISG